MIKNTIKNTISLFTMIMLLTVLFITACSKDKDSNNDASIVGKWKLEKVDYGNGDNDLPYIQVVEFTRDNKLKYGENASSLTFAGTYKQTGNKLEFKLEYEDGEEIEYHDIIKLSDTDLIFKLTGLGDGASFDTEINYFKRISE